VYETLVGIRGVRCYAVVPEICGLGGVRGMSVGLGVFGGGRACSYEKSDCLDRLRFNESPTLPLGSPASDLLKRTV